MNRSYLPEGRYELHLEYGKKDDLVLLHTKCSCCNEEIRSFIKIDQYEKYLEGASAQQAFPRLSTRELNFITTQKCKPCRVVKHATKKDKLKRIYEIVDESSSLGEALNTVEQENGYHLDWAEDMQVRIAYNGWDGRKHEQKEEVIKDAYIITEHHQKHIVALFNDNVGCKVLSYYSDEISFSTNEVIGLTQSKVSALLRRKDTAYLQS